MADSLVWVDQVCKVYQSGSLPALREVSLRLDHGESLALMGPSGCGKTTLLNLIGAMDQPTAGEVFIAGRKLTEYRPYHRFRSRLLGFVFQFHHLVPSLTLLENVELPMYPHRLKVAERRAKALELLRKVGLGDKKDDYPSRVSGGERQRTAIARSLANDPSLILADEPTGSIDSATGQQVIGLLLEYARRTGAGLLMATHNPEIAAMADRTLYLRDGQLAPP